MIPTKMPQWRIAELELAGQGLTKEEFDDGWHWCYDWDGLLIGEDMVETQSCYCHPKYNARRKERMNES